MGDILHDSTPARLITAIEENLSSWIPVFGTLGHAYVKDPVGVRRSITNIPSSLFNSVMDARLAPEQVDPAIQTIVSDAKTRKVPLLWWIGPATRPVDLGKHLEKYSFIHDGESPGMAVNLAKLNESLPTPAGLSIQPAQDDAAWRRWSIVMSSGFGASSHNERTVNAWSDILRQADPETILAYTGWVNDEPVATSLLFLAAGVAGIYAVATIPEARRKGIGAWMTLSPLLYARSKGYELGILQASDMGRSVYSSLGFREYCKIHEYLWRPES